MPLKVFQLETILFLKTGSDSNYYIFTSKNLANDNNLSLFCSQERKYITNLMKNKPIPMTNISLLNKMNYLVKIYGI